MPYNTNKDFGSPRVCRVCGQEKSWDSYYWTNSNHTHKVRICKECQYKEQQARRKENPNEYKVRGRQNSIRLKYNLSLEGFEHLYHSQDGKCAICKKELNVEDRNCCVDHDHNTNEVRGILCRNCNFMLGLAKDDVDILSSAIQYLSMPLHDTNKLPKPTTRSEALKKFYETEVGIQSRSKQSSSLRGDNSPSAALTWEAINDIRIQYRDKGVCQKYLAQKYGINPAHISPIVNNKKWFDPSYEPPTKRLKNFRPAE